MIRSQILSPQVRMHFIYLHRNPPHTQTSSPTPEGSLYRYTTHSYKHRDNNHTEHLSHRHTNGNPPNTYIHPTDITHIYTTPTSSPHIDTSYLSAYTTHTHIDTHKHTCACVRVVCLAYCYIPERWRVP